MQPIATSSLLHLFPDELWRTAPGGRRSVEFTPWYVDRYRGPRDAPTIAAHDYWELTCVMAGNGALTGRTTIRLEPHRLCLIPAGVRHNECGDRTLDTIWVGFTGKRVPARRHIVTVQSRPLALFVEQLWIVSKQRGGPIGAELDGLTATTIGWFMRLLASGASDPGSDLMEHAVQYINQHFSEPTFVDDIARQLGCSNGHFHRQFKRQTGKSPMDYLTGVRIEHAAQLLKHTELPVAEIAARVGYEDPFYFSRVFRKRTGQAPTAQRRRLCRR